ncbi:MAG: ABC transporter ATP-binding protein [Limnochordia bacterium]|nr:ABC transporter ATP-binding protein [Limnochordia bacterium]MDD4518482.1 ABC transporter ATP-binding protein [Limnochordia bacterium]
METADMVAKVIEVHDLRKAYGPVKAVDGVSFHVRKGEVFTLLGPNGAGKTTTIEILEGLKKPDSGRIIIMGQECETVGPLQKDRMGVLLQDTRFISRLRVIEVLEVFSSFFSRTLPVETILERVSLTEKTRAYVEELSGGQRQRLSIGLALLNDPDIIFLDEPTTGLDPQARRNIWELIGSLREDGKSVFLTTHYMEEAEYLSDYVYIMDRGQIITHGTPRELIDQLGQDNIIEFAKATLSDVQVQQLKAQFEQISEKNGRWLVYTKDILVALPVLLDWAKGSNVVLENLALRQPNLEDVFLSMTGRGLRD